MGLAEVRDKVGPHMNESAARLEDCNRPAATQASQAAAHDPTEALIAWLREYAAHRINSAVIDERRTIAPHIVLDLGNQGLLGMQIPPEHGGLLGLNHVQLLQMQRQLGAIDLTLAFFVGLNNGLGVRPILRFAQPQLQQRYLPALATGRILAAFAISEPGAGSNPLAVAARAQREGDGYRVTGTKLWCGSAAWASVISVFARHLDPNGRALGHVGLCIDAMQPGLRVGKEALTMGLRGMVQNDLHLDRAYVGADRVLGSPFAGLSIAGDVMAFGRLGIAATAVGGLWRALQLMVRYASRRQISSGLLYANGHVQRVIGQTRLAAFTLDRFVNSIAAMLDRAESVPPELNAAAKLLASEALWQAADAAVQMLGGRGYCENNGAPQLLRDARITRLFEGPSETLASFIGQRTWTSQASHFSDLFARCPNAGATDRAGLQGFLAALAQRYPTGAGQAADDLFVPLGYVVAWQLVAACAPAAGQPEASWLQHQVELARARVLALAPACAPPAPCALAREIAAHIGDIEQAAAGVESDLDPYLRSSMQ